MRIKGKNIFYYSLIRLLRKTYFCNDLLLNKTIR